MNDQLSKWLKFLCSEKNFHNLCISYPLQLETTQYPALHADIHLKILENLKKMAKHSENSFINSDLLIFDQQEASLNTKDLDLLDEFVKSSALYLPCKIIIIWGPKNLSQTISNKILKLLEDPPVALSFLMLGFSYSSLMPTIRSRFLNWRLTATQVETIAVQQPDFSEEWQNLKNTEEFEKWAVERNLSIEQCLGFLWKLVLSNCNSAQKLDRTLSFQQWFEQSALWNNPIAERWYFLFQMVKNSLQSKAMS